MTMRDEARTADVEAVLALVGRCEAEDGVAPLNESAALVAAGERPGEVHLEWDGRTLAGIAVADPREHSIVVAVDPAHRRQGIGTRLLTTALAAHPDHSVWAFGTLPAAERLAARLSLVPVRQLLRLERDLGEEPEPTPPEGYRITTFSPQDAAEVVAVNAAAFAHHPEQGRLTLDEFLGLTRQPWFSPEGLLLARSGAELAGFHWTKRHDAEVGEVYVLAVHPDHHGGGLGRWLLEAGLAHLARIGCHRVLLYVEADQERVVRLYRSAGLEQAAVDTSYRRPVEEG